MLTIKEMMSIKPHTLLASHTLLDAKKMMEDKKIRHIPIISEHGELEGLVTQRDILSAQSSTLEKNISGDDPMQAKLNGFTKRTILTVSEEVGLKTAALYMQEHKIGCLPVTKEKKLIGIITDSDFVAIAINLLEIQDENEPMDWED